MKRFVLFAAMCGQMLLLCAQEPQCHFSEWLALDTSLTLQTTADEILQKNWVSTVCDNGLWFCPRKPFVVRGKDVQAVIRGVELSSYRRDSLLLSYPQLNSSWKQEAAACCVYALSMEGPLLLMVCDNQLLLYQRHQNKYEFAHRWFCFGVCTGYLHQNKVYALVDDKEKRCYRWMRYESEKAQTAELVRELPQPMPFLLQFEPNRYLQVNEDALYYMPPGENVVKKYSLQGEMLDSVAFELEGWKTFPEEFVRQSNHLPYGVERINHALRNQYRQYFFAKTLDVLSDSLMLLSLNLGDESRGRQLAVMRLQRTKDGWRRDFSTQFISDTSMRYVDGRYPAVFHASGENVMLYPYQNRLLQLLLAPAEEKYEGLTAFAYKKYKDRCFKQQMPVMKLRVQSMKASWRFLDYDNNPCTLESFGKDKVVLVVNRQPQCSGCQQHLLRFLATVDTSDVMLACLMGRVDNYLQRRQQLQQLVDMDATVLKPLYEVENEAYGFLTAQHSYPSVFFWQRGWGIVAVFDTDDIFTEDYNHYEFSPTFLHDIRQFITLE
ncbi:MAG: hypothetical protein J6X16_07095 [Bacteroidales bacterium]|nr:hypothetical protein [Bacteroidales bacterium]